MAKKRLNEKELEVLLKDAGVNSETTEQVLAKNKEREEGDSKPTARGHGNAVPERQPLAL